MQQSLVDKFYSLAKAASSRFKNDGFASIKNSKLMLKKKDKMDIHQDDHRGENNACCRSTIHAYEFHSFCLRSPLASGHKNHISYNIALLPKNLTVLGISGDCIPRVQIIANNR